MKRCWLLMAMILYAAPSLADGLRPFRHASWQDLRQAHQGRPMIIHFWGLTCGPCLVELPAWGTLAQQHPELALITIAADPTPMPPDALTSRLDMSGLGHAENWMFDAMSERLRWEVDPAWQGELPMTIMIAADGLTRSVIGVADMTTVRAWLAAQARQ